MPKAIETIEVNEELVARMTPEQASLFRQRAAEMNTQLEKTVAAAEAASEQADAMIAEAADKPLADQLAAHIKAAELLLKAVKDIGQ